MTNEITVGLVQQSCTVDIEQNLNNNIVKIKSLAKQGANVVVLSELHQMVYFCQTENQAHFNLAESIPGPTTETLSRVAKENSVIIDERDRVIGNGSLKFQLWIRSFVLFVWMVALTEIYDHHQSIPLVYPFFIFITTIISGALAQSFGIIIGYARGGGNA